MIALQPPIRLNPQLPKQQLPVNIPSAPIEQERITEVIAQIESRDDSLAQSQVKVRPRRPVTLKPSIEIDPLMKPYMSLGCHRPVTIPDTLPTSALERYFLPIPPDGEHERAATAEVAAAPDSLYAAPPSNIVATARPVTSAVELALPPSHHRGEGYLPTSSAVFLLFLLAFFTWMRFHFRKNLGSSIQAFFDYHHTQRMQTERKELDRQAMFWTNIFAFMVDGVLLTFALRIGGIEMVADSFMLTAAISSVGMALILLLQVAAWQFVGNVFLVRATVNEYIYNIYLFNESSGLVLFPLTVCLPFIISATPLLYLIASVFGIIYLMRVFRFFQIIRTQRVPSFYFFLYLCTLEILPLLILIKVVSSLITM